MKRMTIGPAIAAALALAVAGCSGGAGGSGGAATEPPQESAKPPAEAGPAAEPAKPAKPVKLTLLARGDTWDPDNAYKPIIERETQTILDYQMVPGNEYVNKRNVVMASGNYPNAIRISPTEPVYQTYLDEGLLLPLDDYLDKYPAVKNEYSPEIWDRNRSPKDGKIYHIPRITGVYPATVEYRKDWADKLGIAEPKTLAEFKEMLVAFKQSNPGGVQEFIPFTPNNNTLDWVNPFLTAFGTGYMAWQPSAEDPGRLILVNTLPAFKDALLFLRELRSEGLFDTEWMVGKSRGLFKFYGGQVGATTDWPQFMDVRLEAVKKVHPEGRIGYITSLQGPTGIRGGALAVPNAQDYGSALVKGTTPEQIDAFFRMLSWQYTEGYDTMKYGVEGKSYDMQNGRKIRRGRDDVLKNDPKYDLHMLDRVFFAEPPKFFAFTEDNFAQYAPDDFKYVGGVLKSAGDHMQFNYLSNANDPVITENINKIKSAVDEVASKIILDPKADADKTFAEYLQKLKQNKIDEVTAAVNRLNPAK